MPPLVLLLLLFAASARADASDGSITSSLPEYDVADSNAAVVTDANLLAGERFWPYYVALTRAWQPSGAALALAPETSGVLIRVEASGMARVDFGRDGLHEVPVAATDLVSSANRIRQGELEKSAPNFVLAIGPRLLDPASDALRPFDFAAVAENTGFLCVFADPASEGFASLAAALAPLRERRGVLTILFPQGAHRDAEVREQLRALAWTVPFVYDHLAEAYTRTLLTESAPPPALLLQTSEGRVIFQGRGRAEVASELASAFDRTFAAAATPGSRATRGPAVLVERRSEAPEK